MIGIYKNCESIVKKIEDNITLTPTEDEAILRLPTDCLICFLHGFLDAKKQLKKVKNFIKNLENKTTYIKYKEAMRVIRKIEYS